MINMNSNNFITENISCRQILNIMVPLGFMVENILKVNLSMAIVVMVIPRNLSLNSSLSHPDHWKPPTFVNTSQSNIFRFNIDVYNSQFTNSNLTTDQSLLQNKYNWNEYEVNFVLGAFFWGYICTEMLGGRLTEIIGAKRVFGYSILIASIITFFTPLAATFGYKAIAGLRVILGVILGPIWPSILPLAAHWIPPTERSRFMSHLIAYTLGTAAVMPVCGFIIGIAGWESVFYFTGIISCIWSIIWFIVIYDSPAQHPRISIEERRKIEEAIGSVLSKKIYAVPWKSILSSAPVWSIIIANFGSIFGFCTITIQLPIYLKHILKYEIEENGVLSALPYVGKYIMGFITATIADSLHRENKLSVTAIRKIFNSIGLFMPGLGFIFLTQFGYDRVIFITMIFLVMTTNGAISAGYIGNTLDFAPNFSGTITGIAYTFSSLGCYFSSLMIGSLTNNNQTFSQWSIVFWIVSGFYMFGGFIFLIFSTGDLQKWNIPDNKDVQIDTELDEKEDDERTTLLVTILNSFSNQISCRLVLNIMVVLGFMLNYMLRVNLTIAIVSMVIPRNSSSSNLSYTSHECSEPSTFVNTTQIRDDQFTANSIKSHLNHSKLSEECSQTRYNWDEYEVNYVLGAFFWGYICTEIPGGRLAEVIGSKKVFGYSTIISSVITLLTPVAASFGYQVVAILRVILGFMLGATFPALYPLASVWIPPTDRSKFISHTMASALGAAVMMQIGGLLIATFGWESVFYFTGGLGTIWSIIWFLVVYDSPAEHPRISAEERRYIEEAIGFTASKKVVYAVPWKSMLTSMPVWAIIITGACNAFGFFTIFTQLPTYMKFILNYKIEENGLLSSLPYIGKYFFGVLAAAIADYLHRENKLSVTAIRKIFNSLCGLAPGACMILLTQFGYDPTASVVIFTIALTLNGAVTAGYLGNGLDIAPNFSGTIFGLANTLSSIAGYLSSLMVGSLTYNNQTYGQWQVIFWILATIYIIGASMYIVFGTGELQKWNTPNEIVSMKKIEQTDIEYEEEAKVLN
ncbi:uncharacterized protein [Chelonus insularis]|uniref:uncharacterized protein n=1 Tax=Chelonus insularis TaxID=460826 RepID=UPI00158F38C2|nr:uncharacterized protein LOC118074826 [Chelonus insularis]